MVYPGVIDTSREEGAYGLNVLSFPEDYLEFRYGEWRTPVSDWVTLRDDGGIRKCTPDEINTLLER